MDVTYKSHLKHPVFKVLSQFATEQQLDVYVIGGWVRDLLMGRPSNDIDILVLGDGAALAKACAQILRVKKVTVFKNFGTAHFRYKDLDVEFVGARKESYSPDSRKPQTSSGSLQDDQNRRDFTINSIAISLRKETYGQLIDPFNGRADLDKGLIRTPLDPIITFNDDPLRMLRAIRFATRFDFEIAANSLEAMKSQAERLQILSLERITDELNKIILTKQPSRGFKLLQATGLLDYFFPELLALQGVETREGKAHKDNFYHTLEVLDNIAQHTDNLWLRWAAILHDIAKPPTKRFDPQVGWTFHGHEELGAKMVPRIFKRLRLPLDQQMKYVQKLVRLHLRPIALVKGSVTDTAIRRLLHEAGDDIDDLMLLCNADITSKNEFKVKRYKQNFELVAEKLKQVDEKDRVRNFQPPVSGQLIMDTYQIGPCAEIGQIKSHIKDAILEGIIANDYSQAVQEMLRFGATLGLKVQRTPHLPE
ncbi:MAG: HD domain-containing protein [Sphingomonadales bacterium]|nr:HD domain-containing protein [Sphingomonadales bacterium]